MTEPTKTSFSTAFSVGQLSETVKNFLTKAFSTTKRTAGKGLDTSLDCYDSCAKELKDQKERAALFITHNPKQSAVIAFGVGAALALIAIAAISKSRR